MKILIPIIGFLSSGGMRTLSQLANNFIKSGHDVHFLCPENDVDPYFPTIAPIFKYRTPLKKISFLRYLSKIICMTAWIYKNRNTYDIILANASATALPVALASISTNKGYYYIQAYEPDFSKERKWPFSHVESMISKLSYKLKLKSIVNSNLYTEYKEIKSNHVVEPGIDLSVFYKRKTNFNNKNSFIVGCIGRKERWKGTHLAIEAVEELRRKYSIDIKINIAFNFPENYNNEKNISFVSLSEPHGDANLADFYRSVDVFCATGLIQNGAFHYPCMEAMACGTPVISNYAPANLDNSFYIENASTAEIVKSLERFINTEEIHKYDKVLAGIETVKAFDWPIISGKMLAIFSNERN